jgi:hypothetical protein
VSGIGCREANSFSGPRAGGPNVHWPQDKRPAPCQASGRRSTPCQALGQEANSLLGHGTEANSLSGLGK